MVVLYRWSFWWSFSVVLFGGPFWWSFIGGPFFGGPFSVVLLVVMALWLMVRSLALWLIDPGSDLVVELKSVESHVEPGSRSGLHMWKEHDTTTPLAL